MNGALAVASDFGLPRVLRVLVVLCAVALAAVVLGGCGASMRQRELRGALVTLDAARDGFVAWDATHQAGLVRDAMSEAQGEAALQAYRDERSPVVEAFEVAYRTLALAATDDKLSAAGLVQLEELKAAVEALEK